jgi:hypothetical protein
MPAKREEALPEGSASTQCETGGDLLSQGESAQVPSAQLDLTSVFGMGTGVTPALSLPRLLHQTLSDLRPDEPCQPNKGRVRSLMSIQLSITTDSFESATTDSLESDGWTFRESRQQSSPRIP